MKRTQVQRAANPSSAAPSPATTSIVRGRENRVATSAPSQRPAYDAPPVGPGGTSQPSTTNRGASQPGTAPPPPTTSRGGPRRRAPPAPSATPPPSRPPA